MKKKKQKKTEKTKLQTSYAHNPRYCMILPDAAKADEEDITSTGQS